MTQIQTRARTHQASPSNPEANIPLPQLKGPTFSLSSSFICSWCLDTFLVICSLPYLIKSIEEKKRKRKGRGRNRSRKGRKAQKMPGGALITLWSVITLENEMGRLWSWLHSDLECRFQKLYRGSYRTGSKSFQTPLSLVFNTEKCPKFTLIAPQLQVPIKRLNIPNSGAFTEDGWSQGLVSKLDSFRTFLGT